MHSLPRHASSLLSAETIKHWSCSRQLPLACCGPLWVFIFSSRPAALAFLPASLFLSFWMQRSLLKLLISVFFSLSLLLLPCSTGCWIKLEPGHRLLRPGPIGKIKVETVLKWRRVTGSNRGYTHSYVGIRIRCKKFRIINIYDCKAWPGCYTCYSVSSQLVLSPAPLLQYVNVRLDTRRDWYLLTFKKNIFDWKFEHNTQANGARSLYEQRKGNNCVMFTGCGCFR